MHAVRYRQNNYREHNNKQTNDVVNPCDLTVKKLIVPEDSKIFLPEWQFGTQPNNKVVIRVSLYPRTVRCG